MARFGSKKRKAYDENFDPSDQAYRWGRSGVEVEPYMLENWLHWHNAQTLDTRIKNLTRQVSGPGVTLHHMTAIVLGVGVFIAALIVDYNIIHEFWTRALSNEFGEVPPSLATTVASKSMQVLFATLSVHYLITHIGHGGRIAYSLLIFAISATMIIGIGLLWANNSLPPGAQVFGFDVNSSAQSVDEFMKTLGVKPPRAAAQPAEVKMLKKYELIIWLFSLGVIFLVVASVGAMALHSAMRGFTGITGGALYDDNKEVRRGHHMRDSLQHAKADLVLFTNDPPTFVKTKLVEFISIYTDGLLDGGVMKHRRGVLLGKANEAARIVRDTFTSGSPDSEHDDNVYPFEQRDKAAHA